MFPSSGQRPGVLLSFFQRTGHPTAKNSLGQNVKSAEAEKA